MTRGLLAWAAFSAVLFVAVADPVFAGALSAILFAVLFAGAA